MGQHFEFRCAACGYETEISGEPSVGATCLTSTAYCSRCLDLFDVVTSDTPWHAESGEPLHTIPCPSCKGRSLEEWRHPGPCPKCKSAALLRGEVTLLWD